MKLTLKNVTIGLSILMIIFGIVSISDRGVILQTGEQPRTRPTWSTVLIILLGIGGLFYAITRD